MLDFSPCKAVVQGSFDKQVEVQMDQCPRVQGHWVVYVVITLVLNLIGNTHDYNYGLKRVLSWLLIQQC